MDILVDHGDYGHNNMGDVAMLKAVIARLRLLRPDAQITVVSMDPDSVQRFCGNVTVVPPAVLRPVTRSPRTYLSLMVGEYLVRKSAAARSSYTRRAFDRSPLGKALAGSSAVVAAGGGYVNDHFWLHACCVLALLNAAQAKGKVTAMFGQGIGPISQPILRHDVRRALPQLHLLAVRETVASQPIAELLGVPRVVMTGDDALHLVNNPPGWDSSGAIGVNLRIASYAGTSRATADQLRDAVATLAERAGARLQPLPVTLGHGADLAAITQLAGQDLSRPEHVGSPEDLIQLVGQCRIVISGSYHAAVFALAHGIPTVGLTANRYYDSKFQGLKAIYGDLITIVDISSPGASDALVANAERMALTDPDLSGNGRHISERLATSGLDAVASLFPRADVIR
jgi:colanic acid/amylovoran biosynthesis protein